MLLLNINTYDCNSPDEDNVTCTINNPDSTLIEFTDDGNNAYNCMLSRFCHLAESSL